jgi:CspA family cold shock protein
MRVFGKVKSFDRTTGVGCAVSDGGAQAAFTVAALEPFGISHIDAGAALTFELTLGTGGLTVAKIYDVAGRAPAGPFERPPRGARWRGRGRVLSYNGAKGFGMVAVDGHDYDALLHHRVVKQRFGVATIGTRTVLDCTFEQGAKGVSVVEIHDVLETGDPPPRERVVGTVDWFDPVKGFGFVRTTEGDAILPLHVVNELGRVTLGTGAQIDCDIVREVDRLRICRVNHVGHEGDVPPMTAVDTTCKWFNRRKGFGMLTAGSAEDIFVHMDTLRRVGLRALRKGERLRVQVMRRSTGRLAAVAVDAVLA